MGIYAPALRTTDATPTICPGGPTIPADSLVDVELVCYARNPVTNDVARWSGTYAARRIGDGIPTAIGSLVKQASPGASTWACTPVVMDATVFMQVTGAAGTTVDWLALNGDMQGMSAAV
jgi:hypothetical protein